MILTDVCQPLRVRVLWEGGWMLRDFYPLGRARNMQGRHIRGFGRRKMTFMWLERFMSGAFSV